MREKKLVRALDVQLLLLLLSPALALPLESCTLVTDLAKEGITNFFAHHECNSMYVGCNERNRHAPVLQPAPPELRRHPHSPDPVIVEATYVGMRGPGASLRHR